MYLAISETEKFLAHRLSSLPLWSNRIVGTVKTVNNPDISGFSSLSTEKKVHAGYSFSRTSSFLETTAHTPQALLYISISTSPLSFISLKSDILISFTHIPPNICDPIYRDYTLSKGRCVYLEVNGFNTRRSRKGSGTDNNQIGLPSLLGFWKEAYSRQGREVLCRDRGAS